jgi:hypothetical protein
MAYMNQTKKAVIAAALKQVVPADWKYSLKVLHHSEIVMTIKSAPVNLIENLYGSQEPNVHVNQYWAHEHLNDCPEKAIILAIIDCLNTGNWDNSDSQTDYFDVGHYMSLNIGNWAKPFVVAEKLKQAA